MQCGDERDDVAVVDEAEVDVVRAVVRKQFRCSVEIWPTQCMRVDIAWPSSVEVQEISCILKVQPFVMCKDFAPRTMSSCQNLETTHLHHAVDIKGLKMDSHGVLFEPLDDAFSEDLLPFVQFVVPKIVTKSVIMAIPNARVPRS